MEDGTIGLFLQEWSRKVFPLLVIYRIIVFAPPLVVLHPMQNLQTINLNTHCRTPLYWGEVGGFPKPRDFTYRAKGPQMVGRPLTILCLIANRLKIEIGLKGRMKQIRCRHLVLLLLLLLRYPCRHVARTVGVQYFVGRREFLGQTRNQAPSSSADPFLKYK